MRTGPAEDPRLRWGGEGFGWVGTCEDDAERQCLGCGSTDDVVHEDADEDGVEWIRCGNCGNEEEA